MAPGGGKVYTLQRRGGISVHLMSSFMIEAYYIAVTVPKSFQTVQITFKSQIFKCQISISSFKYFRTVLAKKHKSVCLFFERIYGATICFRFYLTFTTETTKNLEAYIKPRNPKLRQITPQNDPG